MNILEAVELMKIGKSVRRSSWVNGYRVKMELGSANYNKVSGSTLYGIPVSLFKGSESEVTTMPTLSLIQGSIISHLQVLIEDVVATDWEIYE